MRARVSLDYSDFGAEIVDTLTRDVYDRLGRDARGRVCPEIQRRRYRVPHSSGPRSLPERELDELYLSDLQMQIAALTMKRPESEIAPYIPQTSTLCWKCALPGLTMRPAQ